MLAFLLSVLAISEAQIPLCESGGDVVKPCECAPGFHVQFTYSDGWQVSCVECEIGSFSSSYSAASTCEPCAKGFHADVAGSVMCLAASEKSDTRDRTIQLKRDDSQTGDVCDGSVDNTPPWCVCPEAQYKDHDYVTMVANCDICPPGRYSSVTDSNTVCEACPVGESSSEGLCELCEPGTYADEIASTECKQCDPGTYTAALASAECQNCTVGQTSEEGAIECEWCDPGSYAAEVASIECTLCEAGTHTPIPASEACIECEVGHFSDEGSPDCTECSPGSFAASLGSTECTLCLPGRYRESAAAMSCESCEEGYAAEDFGATRCEACGAGSYNEGINNTECILCEPGKTQGGAHSSTCISCSPGRAVDEWGADYTICPACAQGRYSDETGAAWCESCGIMSYNEGMANLDCQSCLTFDAAFGFLHFGQCVITIYICCGVVLTCMMPGCFYYAWSSFWRRKALVWEVRKRIEIENEIRMKMEMETGGHGGHSGHGKPTGGHGGSTGGHGGPTGGHGGPTGGHGGPGTKGGQGEPGEY